MKAGKSRVNIEEGVRMYRAGMTLQQIGERFGVTRERIRQLIRPYVSGNEGGAARRSATLVAKRSAVKEARCFAKHGIDLSTYKAILAAGGTYAFIQQRKNARWRAIGFSLTLGEWWRIWQDSGKWSERGRGRGKYVLARFNDSGDYEVGNVWVCLFEQNCADAKSHAKAPDFSGGGNVHCLYPGSSRPWVAKHGKTRLGYFETEEEARAAKAAHVAALA